MRAMVLTIVFVLTQIATSSLSVNYDKSIKELVSEGGYESVNYYFSQVRFPEEKQIGEKIIEVRLFSFDHEIIADEVIKAMAEDGFRVATIREFLAYGSVNPDCEKDGDTVTLAKFQFSGLDMVPLIFPDKWPGSPNTHRSLGQVSWDTKWPISHEWGGKPQPARFLGVKVATTGN